ncbi:MAG TPA: protein kinase [Vicinamibacterales bacterium]|nr:protein kinase [Vicinamibacterales bacterium]
MLTTGTRLGAYEIVSLVGVGGMGEVYRARDPRLRRDVAIKVLPAAVATDADRLRRFEQEAQAAGHLNHPNILVVHDIGTTDGSPYLVSELLDGETLRQRLTAGPLSAGAAIDILTQITRGLRGAHESGIVHRDLKPENVFVTRDGRVKILDFGLAKLIVPDAAPVGDATATHHHTRPGVVMGTVGYMAPEQVRGEVADHRCDIFAFGAVMFEVLTGTRAFKGQSEMDVLTDILRTDAPDVTTLKPELPAALARIVARCLEKRPASRFQSTADLCFALENVSPSGLGGASVAAPVPSQARHRGASAGWLIAAMLAAGMAWLWVAAPRNSSPPHMSFVASIAPPASSGFGAFVVSPDGRSIAFTASDGNAMQLWIRSLDKAAPMTSPIKGTAGATNPFWSPDSRSIGFFAGNQLRVVDTDGSNPRDLSVVNDNRGGTWNRDGVIIFAPDFAGPLYTVGRDGGQKRQLTQLDALRQESTHRWPYFLPDGKHYLYFSRSADASHVGIYVGSLDGTGSRFVGASASDAIFAPPDYLLFERDGALISQKFDMEQLTFVEEARPLVPKVGYSLALNRGSMSASNTGVLVYGSTQEQQPVWFDRQGNPHGAAAPSGDYAQLWFSPDESHIVTERPDTRTGANDVFTVELQRGGVMTRVTTYPGSDSRPVWLRDGRIVWASNRNGLYDLYQKTRDGANEEPLLKSGESKLPSDGSPDGRFLLFTNADSTSKTNIRVLPLAGDAVPFPLLDSGFNEAQARFSPDGRWIAYTTDKDGTFEIYIVNARSVLPATDHVSAPPRPMASGRRVSTNGGTQPVWRRGRVGDELFYLAPDRRVMAVTISNEGEPGVPQPLFQTQIRESGSAYQSFLVSQGGERFLVLTSIESSAAATIVFNWLDALAPGRDIR